MNESVKLLTSPKSVYLLSATPEVFHAECIEWTSDITFFRDEAIFMQKLLRDKFHSTLPDTVNHALRTALTKLDQMLNTEWPGLQKAIAAHEQQLGLLMEERSNDHERYRQEHKALMNNMHQLTSDFRNLKRDIFILTEQIAVLQHNISAHFWKGYTHLERHSATTLISDIITRYGTLADTHQFSDMDVSFIAEVPGEKAKELFRALSAQLEMDNEQLEIIAPEKHCRISLNITFTGASGNLKVEPGETGM